MRMQDQNFMHRTATLAFRVAAAATAAVLTFVLLVPAGAQWFDFRRPSAPIPQQNQGGWFQPWYTPERPPQRSEEPPRPVDYSRAPAPARRPAGTPAANSTVLVIGDAMADWLAYGLE